MNWSGQSLTRVQAVSRPMTKGAGNGEQGNAHCAQPSELTPLHPRQTENQDVLVINNKQVLPDFYFRRTTSQYKVPMREHRVSHFGLLAAV